MQGTRVMLARHAETAAPNRFHGAESDIGLSELGVRQAERLAEYLSTIGPAAIYSSAMRRAVETTGADRTRVQPRSDCDRRTSRATDRPAERTFT